MVTQAIKRSRNPCIAPTRTWSRCKMPLRYYVTLSTGYEIDIVLEIGRPPLQNKYDWNLTLSNPHSGVAAGRSRAFRPSASRASVLARPVIYRWQQSRYRPSTSCDMNFKPRILCQPKIGRSFLQLSQQGTNRHLSALTDSPTSLRAD